LLDVEYTLLFQRQYVITARKTHWVPKAKTPDGRKENILPVAFVHSRVKIKIVFWSKLEVFHVTETKNVDTRIGKMFFQ